MIQQTVQHGLRESKLSSPLDPESCATAGNTLQTPGQLIDLINRGLIYSDVHTLTRVSPSGLTRGPVRRDDGNQYGNDDDDITAAAAGSSATVSGDDGSESDDSSESSDDGRRH